jgi:uncharacterized protein (TIGR03437 family)
MAQLEQVYAVFVRESAQFTAADQIDKVLRAALYFERASDALSFAERYPISVRNRLQIAASRLAQAQTLFPGGATSSTFGDDAHAPALAGPPVIGAVTVVNGANAAPLLAPNSMGFIYADQSGQTPLAMQTAAATQLSADALPFELASASVTIAGRAAQVFDVSPTRISFCVPAGLAAGDAEVIVTSQEGYVSRGIIHIAAVVPSLFNANGAALVLNATTGAGGTFDVTTDANLSSDKRTRLQILAAGFSAGAANTSATNDVQLDGGAVAVNLAESVAVEARTTDGRVYLLPVEYAGALGRVAGLDQVNVILVPELRGAGNVTLTLVVAGQRSNSATISVR